MLSLPSSALEIADRRCRKADRGCRKADRRSGTATGHAPEKFHQFFQALFLGRRRRQTAPPVLAAAEEWAQTGRANRAHGTGTAVRGKTGSDRGGLTAAVQALRNCLAASP